VLKHPTSPDQIAFTGGNMASHSVIPRDTQFLHAALHNWQKRNRTARTFLELSPAEQSEIMGDAQDLKQNAATELERATIEIFVSHDVDVHAALAIAKVRIRRKLMRKFGIVAVAMITVVVASVAWGQTTAPSMTVFGLELGKPFTVPECSLHKLGRKDYVYAGDDKAVCFELNFVHHKSDPRSIPVTDGAVALRFPIEQPMVVRDVAASVIKGNLESVEISTAGISDESVILDMLVKKYGKPSSSSEGSAQSAMGAQFPTLLAVWHFSDPDLTVLYKSVDGRFNHGSISIQTRTAIMTGAANLPKEPKL
jgi:hypothetical protein